MAGPSGAAEVFKSHNEQGFSRNATVNVVHGKRISKGVFETGTCAGMSALFLRKTLDKGTMVSASDVGGDLANRVGSGGGTATFAASQAAIAQAAYEFGSISHGDSVLDDRKSLLEAFNLKTIETDRRDFTDLSIRIILWNMLSNPGNYFIGTPSHNMAAVTTGSAAFFFDPDEGLYKWDPIAGFVSDLSDYLTTDYAGDLDEPMEILKVRLE